MPEENVKPVVVPDSTNYVTAQTASPMNIALMRGLALAFCLAALDILTGLSLDQDFRKALISGGISFFGIIVASGILGRVDETRASKV